MSTLVITKRQFYPITLRDIERLKTAKSRGDSLAVIVENDEQINDPYSISFDIDRLSIIQHLKMVDCAILSVDTDKSSSKSIAEILSYYAESMPDNILFVTDELTYEDEQTCKRYGILIHVSESFKL